MNRAADRLEYKDEPEAALEIAGRALALLDGHSSTLGDLHTARAHQVAAEAYLRLDRIDDAIDSYAKAERGYASNPRFAEYYVRFAHDAAITFGNLGMEEVGYFYASRGADAAADLPGGYLKDLERLKLSFLEPGAEEYQPYLERLRAVLAGATEPREVRALRHRLARALCEFGDLEEVQEAFAEIEALYAEAETPEQQIVILGPLGYLQREPQPFPEPLFVAACQAVERLTPAMESTLQADAYGVHAVALWSRGKLEDALAASLRAVGLRTAHAWHTGSSTVRLLIGAGGDSARHLALKLACELGEAELAAELIESARMAALPNPDVPRRVVALLRPGEPTEVAQRSLGPLHPISVRGRSRLADCYPPTLPLAAPIELDETIDAIGGPGAWWWGAWMGADEFRFWATRDEHGRYSCGYGDEGRDLVMAALEMCPALGSRESARYGAFTASYAAEEALSVELGAFLIPPPLAATIRPTDDSHGDPPPISLVVASNFLSALPLALLGVGAVREGRPARLLERATLRIAPPAALVAGLGGVEERPLPYPLSIACIDATDELGLSGLPVSPVQLLGGEDLCAKRSGARLADLDNLVDTLREVDDGRSVFGYFGHAAEGEVGADLGSYIPLADGTRLTAEDVFAGREDDGGRIPFPERILLSACGSAGSTGAGSGEWLGLTAGMLCAGAREVVATAWPIWNLPITKELDVALLSALEQRQNVAAELRRVQLDCLADWRATDEDIGRIELHGDATEPFPLVWAAYQYVGVPPSPTVGGSASAND